MNKHGFTLNNFKAIKYASIENEGLTVIAGENGSGKSTLSRFVYYVVNLMSTFDNKVAEGVREELINLLDGVFDALFQLYSRSTTTKKQIQEQWESFRDADFTIDDLEDAFDHLCNISEPLLRDALLKETDYRKLQRYSSFLGITFDNTDTKHSMDQFWNNVRSSKNKMMDEAKSCIDLRPMSKFIEIIHDNCNELYDLLKKNFSIYENEVELTSKFFHSPLMLQNAIYVDTPMAVSNSYYYSGNRTWRKLSSMLTQESIPMNATAKKIYFRINKIIQGRIQNEDLGFANLRELHYRREDGLNIRLDSAATGIKAFAYLEMLLANGFLTKETMLIIDEPEAHLHPQWVVEFARLLVLLQKEIGIKIMIASHNPDMVAAIRSIAEGEGLLDKTRFYIAEREEEGYQYVYRDLGTDIAPIFQSFNIALDRIKQYGA